MGYPHLWKPPYGKSTWSPLDSDFPLGMKPIMVEHFPARYLQQHWRPVARQGPKHWEYRRCSDTEGCYVWIDHATYTVHIASWTLIYIFLKRKHVYIQPWHWCTFWRQKILQLSHSTTWSNGSNPLQRLVQGKILLGTNRSLDGRNPAPAWMQDFESLQMGQTWIKTTYQLLDFASHSMPWEKTPGCLYYPVVRRERFGARGIHIFPYLPPKNVEHFFLELLRVSQPSDSYVSYIIISVMHGD